MQVQILLAPSLAMNDNFAEIFADPRGDPSKLDQKYDDLFNDADYQKFVESMVPHCRCDSQYRPCDGVLAGGLCDDMHDREIDLFDNEEDL